MLCCALLWLNIDWLSHIHQAYFTGTVESNDCPSASKATLMNIDINTSCEFIMNDCITTTKQSTTKPCAYFLGYTVHAQIFVYLCYVTFTRSVPSGFMWLFLTHNDVIKWKHFPHNWPFVRGIHRSPVNSPHKGQWRGALMFYLICAGINDWVNNREAGDLRRNRARYDVIVMHRPQGFLTLLQTNISPFSRDTQRFIWF